MRNYQIQISIFSFQVPLGNPIRLRYRISDGRYKQIYYRYNKMVHNKCYRYKYGKVAAIAEGQATKCLSIYQTHDVPPSYVDILLILSVWSRQRYRIGIDI